MNNDFYELSETELQSVIKDAEKVLQEKQALKRKEVIEKIHELAASVNLQVEITEGAKESNRRGVKVPIKYRNPDNDSEQWTGRGLTPNWLKKKLASGFELADFKV